MLNKRKADMGNRKIICLTKLTWWTPQTNNYSNKNNTKKIQPFATIHNLSATCSPVKLVPSVCRVIFFLLIFYLSLPTKIYLIYYVCVYTYIGCFGLRNLGGPNHISCQRFHMCSYRIRRNSVYCFHLASVRGKTIRSSTHNVAHIAPKNFADLCRQQFGSYNMWAWTRFRNDALVDAHLIIVHKLQFRLTFMVIAEQNASNFRVPPHGRS